METKIKVTIECPVHGKTEVVNIEDGIMCAKCAK